MKILWIFLSAVMAATQATFTYRWGGCHCNGRSRYCLRDAWGLHCLDCQGNSAGRHCERCKDGFYLPEEASLTCKPCSCNPTGSVGVGCDSRGRCSCVDGVSGPKCDRCPDGPIGPNGCPQSRQAREDSGSSDTSCFCYGHSSVCSLTSGFSVHNIDSNFNTGADGWTVSTATGGSPDAVHFRWSAKHQDVEVISRNSVPVYLSAPAPYLGNHLLSYGQNLSFSLRLDRGVRHPSTSDVILEGGGLRVSSSLGDLRSIVPCGQKINYSFRLDERPGGRWRPRLSSFDFQTLLQNVTAVRIRATFGENGRGYLDDVRLVSAQRGGGGGGGPARWVWSCRCPAGHGGEFCQLCSAGFSRRTPARGAFSACRPCDPRGGECLPRDETPHCPPGSYRGGGGGCLECPCPNGGACSMAAGTLEPQCEHCPPGTTGPRCAVCQQGFFGNPSGAAGVQRPCKPCECDVRGSQSALCDAEGRCRCRPGFGGSKCQRPKCPACFSPIETKVEVFGGRLEELQGLLGGVGGAVKPTNSLMEDSLTHTQQLLHSLQDSSSRLAGLERSLQGRLASVSRDQLTAGQEVHNAAAAAAAVQRQRQKMEAEEEEVHSLMEELKRQLGRAKAALRSAELPVGDAPLSPSRLSPLAQTAVNLSHQHELQAAAVEKNAAAALRDSEKSRALVRTLMTSENKVSQLIGDLKTTYDQISAEVKNMESSATRVSSEASNESKMAARMLAELSSMEGEVPSSPKVVSMLSQLSGLREEVDGAASALEALQDGVLRDKTTAQELLSQAGTAQQEASGLLNRANEAKSSVEDSLQRISSHSQQLDQALRTLTDFDQQINSSRVLASAAIQRLPAVSDKIQQAENSNSQARNILSMVEPNSLGTMNQLENLVTSLEGAAGSLPSHDALLAEASKLKQDSASLRTEASEAAGQLQSELEAARTLEAEATQAARGAAAALANGRQARGAVERTLQEVNDMMDSMGDPDAVDVDRLDQLEVSLLEALRQVEVGLRPRLEEMEEQEEAQKQQLRGINHNIDNILRDISNLEDILRTVPKGCFNSPPIEEA